MAEKKRAQWRLVAILPSEGQTLQTIILQSRDI